MQRYWKGDIEAADPRRRDRRNFELLRAFGTELPGRSPFYGNRLQGVDFAEIDSWDALADLPVVEKPEILADQAANSPYGSMIGCHPDEIVRQYIGPGPQTTYWTAADEKIAVDDGAWAFWTNGFRPSDTVDITIMYHWVIAGTLMDDACRAIGCATIPGGIGMNEQHLNVWRWSNVSAVFAFPTFLDQLGDAASEAGLDPANDFELRVITVSGEQREADAKQRMSEFWGGAAIREFYGGSEVPFIASESEDGSGDMHINPDLIVEVVDPETMKPVPEGSPGVVVATDPRRRAYPMVRYFTGDITAGLTHGVGSSGRTTPRIGRILGRHGDIPRVKGLFVVPGQVGDGLSEIGVFETFQLVVTRPGHQDELTIRVETVDPEASGLADRLSAAVKVATRLTADVELVAVGTLRDQPTIDDRRQL
ncbi:MAG: phenylacetate--CoA ligase [bacterium]|nr:phenylacetate--CoA ligase [bacterium]